MRLAVLVLAGLQAALLIIGGFKGLFSGSDPATRGLDQLAGLAALAVAALTVAPAFALAWVNRYVGLALVLTLLPVFVLGAVIAWLAMA
jgi:hypothetical protein